MPDPVNRTHSHLVDGLVARAMAWWPSHCLLCAERTETGRHDLCAACTQALPRNASACGRCAIPLPEAAPACGACLRAPPPIDALHAAFVYRFPVDRLLPRFKFHGDLAAGRLLAQGMADAFTDLPRPPALVPVPLHRARLRERGYDQTLELARPLARALRVPLLRDALLRTRRTDPQSRLDAAQRRRNVRGAFDVRANTLPAHVVLVDDVMTTGATLHAAAHALRRAGVARVEAWVCARVP